MIDRRKLLIEAAMCLEEWLGQLEGRSANIPIRDQDILMNVIEKHLEEMYQRGYLAAKNPDSLDNLPSE